MNPSNPGHEREQLARFYAASSEAELRGLAEDANSLTQTARETLQVELKRREMPFALEAPAPPPEVPATPNLVTLRRFRDLPEALVAKGTLDSAGIACFLGDENMIRMDWLISNGLGGIKLWVRQEDAESAASLLNQGFAEGFEADIEGQ